MVIVVDLINHELESIFGEQFWMLFFVIKWNVVQFIHISVDLDFRVVRSCQIERAEAIESYSREDATKGSFHTTFAWIPLTSDLDVSLVVKDRHLTQLFGS